MDGGTGTLLRALAFAAERHSGQRRKDAAASPYINHPIALADVLANEGRVLDVVVLSAAMLHDVGRGSTPLDLLHRTGGMSDQEWADVLRHPARGVEILRRADFDDPVSCDVVLRRDHAAV